MQIGECQILEENHENGSETGPYGSVRADIHTGWIPQALGSLWDASRALKRPWKINKSRFEWDYDWHWNNNQDSATGISMTDYPKTSQWYYVEATDNIGCKGIDSIYVVVGAVPYDAITPNGDGINDEWEILDIDRYPNAEIQIFNRWGSLIFSSSGANYNNNKWQGNFENKELPVGTYYYTINLNDGSELQTGAVTIVR